VQRRLGVRSGDRRVHVGTGPHQRRDARRAIWEVPRPIGDDVQQRAPHAFALEPSRRQARALTQLLLEGRYVTSADRADRRHGNRLASVDDRRLPGVHHHGAYADPSASMKDPWVLAVIATRAYSWAR
jgi:hypothetical protein